MKTPKRIRVGGLELSPQACAQLSPCGHYRYWLSRGTDPGKLVFIGLNPSTADSLLDDPTVRRLRGYSTDWGFTGFTVVNLFAFRATDPRQLRTAADPVGPGNDSYVMEAAGKAEKVVAMWGVNGVFQHRDLEVMAALKSAGIPLETFGLTAGGHPKHPLYLPANTELRLM